MTALGSHASGGLRRVRSPLAALLTSRCRADRVVLAGDAFADDPHGKALLAQSFQQRIYDTTDEVLAKHWPLVVHDRIQDEPDRFIVVIEQRFRDFDPREHPYAVIWSSEKRAGGRSPRPRPPVR